MRPCSECGKPTKFVFCILDFILLMKAAGFSNKTCRDVYYFGKD